MRKEWELIISYIINMESREVSLLEVLQFYENVLDTKRIYKIASYVQVYSLIVDLDDLCGSKLDTPFNDSLIENDDQFADLVKFIIEAVGYNLFQSTLMSLQNSKVNFSAYLSPTRNAEICTMCDSIKYFYQFCFRCECRFNITIEISTLSCKRANNKTQQPHKVDFQHACLRGWHQLHDFTFCINISDLNGFIRYICIIYTYLS